MLFSVALFQHLPLSFPSIFCGKLLKNILSLCDNRLVTVEDHQVRGLLSRPRRRPAGGRRFGGRHLGVAVLTRRHRGDGRRHHRAALQRHRGGAGDFRGAG